MFAKVSPRRRLSLQHRCRSVICTTIWAQLLLLCSALLFAASSADHIDDAAAGHRLATDQFAPLHSSHHQPQQEPMSPPVWHSVTESVRNLSLHPTSGYLYPPRTTLTPLLSSTDWQSRSLESDFNRDYFNQMNALHHKPMHSSTLHGEESQVKPSISPPPSAASESRGLGQDNVYYFSPTSYGKSSTPAAATATVNPPVGKNVPTQVVAYPNRSNASMQPYTGYWSSSPSREKLLSALAAVGNTETGGPGGNQSGKAVYWSTPLVSKPADEYQKSSGDLPSASYSNELNKLLLQKYYNRDLSAMSALLGKYPAVDQNVDKKEPSSATVDRATDEEDDEEVTDDEEEVDEKPEKNTESVQYLRPATMEHSNEYSNKVSKLAGSHLVGEYKGRSGEILRVHGTPRIVRQYPSHPRSMHRLQAAHSHAVPHYYVPHGSVESTHHHLTSHEKGHTWLGGGLAAGILIGAIPFGIMMATMMPTLLTTAMPIVNTATVAGKRRKRGADIKNLFIDQTLDTLSLLLSKGFKDFLSRLKEPPRRQYAQKNDHYENVDKPNTADEVLKVVARYAIAAVDEPKCIKEMVCTLVASGKHSETTPIQKTLYTLTKWIPKDIERTLGLNGLFTAIRKNACLSTYQCPITVIDGMRKRSSFAFSNARKMT